MSRTVVAVLVLAGAFGLSGFSCGGTPQPAVNPLTCYAQFRGAANEDLWCIPGTFDYTTLPDGGVQSWALNMPMYRGPLMNMEVAGGVGFFAPGPPVPGVAYGWDGIHAPNVSAGGAQRYVGAVPPGFAVMTHEMVVPMSWPDLGKGTLSVTFSVVPGPTDYLGAHGVVSATLPSVDGVAGPVTLTVAF